MSETRDVLSESGKHWPFKAGADALELSSIFEADPLIGQVIDQKFEIICTVGTGTWSRVYRAKSMESGTEIALKIMHAQLISNAEIIARFQREIQTGLKLNHPNVCKIFAYGTLSTGQPYIAMEYVDGETLAARLRRKTFLSLQEAMPIFTACCDALEHAHGEYVVHRDIKPGNIMIAKDASVKLLDFGLAKFIRHQTEDLTQAGTPLGTVKYLSPEQAMGETVDARSDLYSLACVFYEMLTGSAVFDGTNLYQVIEQHLHRLPRKFREVKSSPDVPIAVEQVILRALSKAPSQRLQSAHTFKEAVQNALTPATKRKLPTRNELLWLVTGILTTVVVLYSAGMLH